LDNTKFNLEFGKFDDLTGNAFAYWEIEITSDEKPVKKIVVTNFIVSPLFFNKHTIAATFPPVIFETKEKMLEIARKANIDIIKIESVEIPENNFDFTRFFRKQLSSFNKIVTKYSLLYSDKLSGVKMERSPESQNEIENLQQINRLAEEAREAFVLKRNKVQARDMIIQMKKIGNTLNSPSFKYDIENLIILLKNPDSRVDKLSELYFKKFLAIYTEQYEEAAMLKEEIKKLSHTIKGENENS